jgi:hypothetical protein
MSAPGAEKLSREAIEAAAFTGSAPRQEVSPESVLTDYVIVAQDVKGPFIAKLPKGLEAMKDLPALGCTSPKETLAEKFHMSEALLTALNPRRD